MLYFFPTLCFLLPKSLPHSLSFFPPHPLHLNLSPPLSFLPPRPVFLDLYLPPPSCLYPRLFISLPNTILGLGTAYK